MQPGGKGVCPWYHGPGHERNLSPFLGIYFFSTWAVSSEEQSREMLSSGVEWRSFLPLECSSPECCWSPGPASRSSCATPPLLLPRASHMWCSSFSASCFPSLLEDQISDPGSILWLLGPKGCSSLSYLPGGSWLSSPRTHPLGQESVGFRVFCIVCALEALPEGLEVSMKTERAGGRKWGAPRRPT